MISSGYVTLAGFLAALQLAAAAWAMLVGARNLAARSPVGDDAIERLEARTYLAGLLGYLLLGTSIASWLVLYLVLDSFVPQWKGAMCIYGVTQIGEGSHGVYRWLPKLLALEQTMKPALIFATGAALVLYRFHRRLGTRTLLPRVAAVLFCAAALAAVDAGVELAYLAIPKRESLPSSGCCSASGAMREQTPPPGPDEQRRLSLAYFGSQALLAVLLLSSVAGDGMRPWRVLALSGLAVAVAVVSMRFFIHVASPTLLHLPYHHCIYDLVTGVPESGVALALLFWATFCVGWSAIVNLLGRCADSRARVGGESRRWLCYSLPGYLGSLAMISLDLWLA